MKLSGVTFSAVEDPGVCSRRRQEADCQIRNPKSEIRNRNRLLTSAATTVLVAVALVAAGCASKSKSKQREAEAYRRGQEQAREAQRLATQPFVWFRGAVRNQRVPWQENLTLSQAILAAQYTSGLNPTRIFLFRQGQMYRIDPRRLLRGQEDPVLEPGDLVEIAR